jgi:hypothetical protein
MSNRSDPEEPEQPTGAFHWLVPADEEDPEAERSQSLAPLPSVQITLQG